MRRPCSLCQTHSSPEAHAFLVEDGIERRVCLRCSERLAAFVLESEGDHLSALFHMPASFAGALAGACAEDDESARRYTELGLLDDALLEAAEAIAHIPDDEVRAQAIEVIFGLLRDHAWPGLRGRLFPA